MFVFFRKKVEQLLYKKRSIAALVTFRILFGTLLSLASIRFWGKGWIDELFIKPDFFFKYYGFEWVTAVPDSLIKPIFAVQIISAAFIALGWYYRTALIAFILSFSYFELLDASNYLNHHYLVILFAFLLLFVPANRAFSLDVKFRKIRKAETVPAWCINIFCLQILIVYSFAGMAKLNSDWLLRAMPLAIWLPERSGIPVLGPILSLPATAFIFSWFAAMYDCTIAWFLMFRKTRLFAYGSVVLFHILTGLFFNIGIFPAIMISSNLIFFSDEFHQKLYKFSGYAFPLASSRNKTNALKYMKVILPVLTIYFCFQLLFPLRHLLYPGKTVYTEEGYRLSWRVMLLEKSGIATFRLWDKSTGRWSDIDNSRYLTEFQEKQMAIQADFMLQYAQYLASIYRESIAEPAVTINSHVSINGNTSFVLIDPETDLLKLEDSFQPKTWLLPHSKP